MPQQVCPWCGKCGIRYDEGLSYEELCAAGYMPHDDGSTCVCRHVSSHSRIAALRDGGRYWDGKAWVCPSCGTAPAATAEELDVLERLMDE